MFKKLLSLVLILAMVFSIAPISAFATSASDFGYDVVNGEVSIYSYYEPYENPPARVEIPASIDGYPVTHLSYGMLDYVSSVTVISVPATVKTIDDGALYTSTLEKIEVDSANPVFESKDGVLFNKQDSSIVAYPANKAAASYEVPEGTTEIKSGAFTDCKNLKSIKLPSTLKNLNEGFVGCDNLNKIEFASSNPYFIIEDNVVYNKNKTKLLLYPENKKDAVYTVPNTVNEIDDCALHSGNKYLKELVMSDSITEIGSFSAFPNLTKVKISKNIKRIPAYAFYGTNLAEVEIPVGVESIGRAAFKDCQNLKTVKISSTVENFIVYYPSFDYDYSSFAGCTSLTRIDVSSANKNYASVDGMLTSKDKKTLWYIPQGIKGKLRIPDGIEKVDLELCIIPNGTTSIYLPATADAIPERNNLGLRLESIEVAPENKNYTSIDGVLFSKDKKEMLYYPEFKKDTTYTVPKETEIVSMNIGRRSPGYLEELIVHKGVKEVNAYGLVGESIFRYEGSKSEWQDIASVSGETEKYAFLSDGVYEGSYEYKIDENGDARLLRYLGTSTDVVVPSTIAGKKVASISAKLFADNLDIVSVKLPGTITEIPDETFASLEKLNTVTISEGVTSIGEFAFEGCTSLVTVNLPKSLTSIGFRAFYGASELKNITIPENVKTIEINAFENCPKLTDLALPDGLTELTRNVINTTADGTLNIPANVKNISRYLNDRSITNFKVAKDNPFFADIDGVLTDKSKKTIIMYPEGRYDNTYAVPKGIETIASYAFKNDSLINLILPDTLKKICSNAVEASINEVTIPASVEIFEPLAFNSYGNTNFIVDANNKNYYSFEGSIYSKDMKRLVATGKFKTPGEFYVPDGVEVIEENAFTTMPLSLHIPDSVRTIKPNVNDNLCDSIYYHGIKEDWKILDIQSYKTVDDYIHSRMDLMFVPDPLKTPEIVSAFSRTQNSVKITWKSVPEADGYKLYRSENPNGGFKCVKTIKDPKATYYTNGGLEEGKTYYYKVQAYKISLSGKWIYSDFSTVDFMPAAVVFNNVYSNATYRIRSLWNVVGGAEGYQLWRADSPDGEYKIVKTIKAGDIDAYSNTGLESGKNYSYKMRAYYTKPTGEKIFGAFSDVQTVAVMPKTPAVTVYSNGVQSARIKWNSISGAAGYQIWRADASGNYTLIKSVTDPNATGYTNKGLKSGEEYTYKVRAYTEVNGKKTFGAYSNPVNVTVK